MKLRELIYILKFSDNIDEIYNHTSAILKLIPELRVDYLYNQNNHAHQYDLLEHQYHTVLNLPRGIDDDMLYLAALIHDVGKPYSRVIDYKNGVLNCHYYGHPEKSEIVTRNRIIPYLIQSGNNISVDNQQLLLYYVRHHDDHVSFKYKYLHKYLDEITLEQFQHLMLLENADALAHVMLPKIQDRADNCKRLASDKVYELLSKMITDYDRQDIDTTRYKRLFDWR